MKQAILATSMVAAAILWLQLGTNTHAGESGDRTYWYSSDPGEALLIVRFAGGRSASVHRHTVFADGRYEYRLTDHSGSQVHKQSEIQLTPKDVTTLLDRAVHSGLMEFDRETIEERMRATRPPYIASDADTMFLEINLERYRGPEEQEATATAHSMSLRDAYFQAQLFPDIEEIQALEYIGRTVEEFQRQAGTNDAR
jgi:hypothetical protein